MKISVSVSKADKPVRHVINRTPIGTRLLFKVGDKWFDGKVSDTEPNRLTFTSNKGYSLSITKKELEEDKVFLFEPSRKTEVKDLYTDSDVEQFLKKKICKKLQ